MNHLESGDLTIEVAIAPPDPIRLNWLGRSTARQPGAVLGPFFAEVAATAKAGRTSVEMRFESLQHFNSSTISAIIQFIQLLRDHETRLLIVFDGKSKWQQLSFDALRIFEKPDGLLTFRPL